MSRIIALAALGLSLAGCVYYPYGYQRPRYGYAPAYAPPPYGYGYGTGYGSAYPQTIGPNGDTSGAVAGD